MASTEPRRGEVWLVSFGAARRGEPGKNRPAVVVSADRLNAGEATDLIVVVPLSSSSAPSALRPEIEDVEGVDRASRAIPRALRAVVRGRLLRRVGAVKPETLLEIERTLALVLGMNLPAA